MLCFLFSLQKKLFYHPVSPWKFLSSQTSVVFSAHFPSIHIPNSLRGLVQVWAGRQQLLCVQGIQEWFCLPPLGCHVKRGQGNQQVPVFPSTCKCEVPCYEISWVPKCFAKGFQMIWLESKKCQTSHCKLGSQPSFVLRSDSKDFERSPAVQWSSPALLLALPSALESKKSWI